MLWIPIVIGAGAAGAAAAALLGDEEEKGSSSTGRQSHTHFNQSRTSATQDAQRRERLKRKARYRESRNERVDAFLDEHNLKLLGAAQARKALKPELLLSKVEDALERRFVQIERPLAAVEEELGELSAIRDELVSINERRNH